MEHPMVAAFDCSEPNSEFSGSNCKSKLSKITWKFSVFGLGFSAFLKPVLAQVLLLCPRGKAALPFGACFNVFVEFMASFPFQLNSLPQPPACEVAIILLPHLVSLINVVEHSDSDKQPRKAQRK